MKISEMLQGFHTMQACDRMDLICRMLRHCVPYEARFLGTILLDASREHYKSHANKIEINANRVNYYVPFKTSGLTHSVCEKLCCALAVVHSDNHPVAESIFNLLNDAKVLKLFEESNELKVMQDYRLLYVMAVNHPALSFNQRQLLMYNYLQRMDLVFVEKSKYSFSGSFSGSVEKTLSGEADSSRYPPEVLFGEAAPDAYLTRCEVHSVYKRAVDKRHVYMIQVEWSDGTTYTVRRTYGDFFSFQTKLLDLFPEEGGQKGKKHPRLIPYLPGKNYQRFLKNKETAEKRLPELHRYSRELISLPDRIPRSHHVLEFFRPRPCDTKEEYPPLHKITTLYDLIESGKARSRVFSEPLKGSPTHSPITHSRGSPLQRAALTASAEVSPSTPSRISQTLPPPVEAANEKLPPVIPRRPTYPLPHKIKSESSAFTSVFGTTSLSEDELASTATLTASQVSISGMSPSSTPSSHLSSSSTSLTTPTITPTSTLPSQLSHQFSRVQTTPVERTPTSLQTSSEGQTTAYSLVQTNSTADAVVSCKGQSPTIQNTYVASPQAAFSTHVGSHIEPQFVLGMANTLSDTAQGNSRGNSHYVTTGSPGNTRHPVAVLQQRKQPNYIQGVVSSVPNMCTTTIAHLVPIQPMPMYPSSSSPHTTIQEGPTPGSVIYTGGVLNARGEVIVPSTQTSPTGLITSPLLTSSVRHSVNTPSPPHSGTTTPHGGVLMNAAGYSSSQILYNITPTYSPIPAYPYFSGSPIASPVPPSPKTPKKMYSSYTAVNRASNEHDSLIRWLKSLRLHKYYSMFDNITFEEMCSMSVEQLETRGMTNGAAKKLFRKLEELKRNNFPGFRDMTVAAGMSRKPSTCSLPASLLMERGITPSSSFEGFSPTGSTCSLDKFGQSGSGIGRAATPSQQHHSHQHSGPSDYLNERHYSKSEGNSVIEDTAILKVVPLNSSLSTGSVLSSPNVQVSGDALMSEDPLSSAPKPGAPSSSVKKPPTPPPKPNSSSAGHLDSSAVGRLEDATASSRSSPGRNRLSGNIASSHSEGQSASWADQVVPSEDLSVSSQPEWAQMPGNGEVNKLRMNPSQSIIRTTVGSLSDTQQIIPIRTHPEQSNPFHQFTLEKPSQSQATSKPVSNTPSRSRHAPLDKRNSSEGHSAPHNSISNSVHPDRSRDSSPSLQTAHPPTHVGVGNRNEAVAMTNSSVSSNWIAPVKHLLLPGNVSVIKASPTSHNAIQHPQQHVVHRVSPHYPNASVNGVLKSPAISGRHTHMMGTSTGFVGFNGGRFNHIQNPPPVTCFNCGKRGHLGYSCPANTMETNNPETFHKKLEKMVHSTSKSPVS